MRVYAHVEADNNVTIDETEETHVYWIDLSNPDNRGRQY